MTDGPMETKEVLCIYLLSALVFFIFVIFPIGYVMWQYDKDKHDVLC